MDEAINSQTEHFLIKPVNPSQIFMACKQILENKFQEQKATKITYHTLIMLIQN